MRHGPSGGTERHLDQIAAALTERGHEVTIVCRSHGAPPHPAVRFAVLRDFAPWSTWRMWAFARALERHVAREPYDVVYGLGKTWTQDVIRLGGGSHATYLERAHPESRAALGRALRGSGAKNRLALAIERRALAPGAYAAVVVNAEMVKRDVMERYAVPADRVHVIRNAVDLERFRPDSRDGRAQSLRRSCGFVAEDRVILFLGSGYGRKGLDRVLDAFPGVLRARPRARLLVAGRDSAQRRYARLARRLGLGACTSFLGPRADAETCYRASDVYVLPSRYDPFANTTLEALASGLPVVTSDANGASEILRGTGAGTVLPAGFSDRELVRALVEWSDPARTAEGSHAARALAEKHPTSEMADRTERLLVEIAREKGR
jgi:UDP-glucose:(heptosyl)LPS alpha-1,3-glucosyltransferase